MYNNYFYIELAIQINANDKTVRGDTVQGFKEFNNQSLATQSKKSEKLASMMPAIKKALNLLVDGRVDLSTEKDALKNKIGSYDEKLLEESEAKLSKQIDDEKRGSLIMLRM